MTTNTNPTHWIIVEILSVLSILALILNQFHYYWFELTGEDSIPILLLALGALYWSTPKVENSSYTRYGLYWNRLIKPGYRAVRGAFKQASKRIFALDLPVKLFEENQARAQSRQVVDDFVTIAFDELAMDSSFRPTKNEMDSLADDIATGAVHPKRDGYRRIADTLFSGESSDDEKIRLILIYCREYVKSNDTLDTGESIHEIQGGISRALSASSCDFESWNESAERLLTAYGNAYNSIHHGEPLSSDPLKGSPSKKPKKYYNDFREYFLPFRDRSSLSEELVATIIDVVDRGELDQSAVAREVDKHLEEERERIKAEQNQRQAYLLVSMKAGLWDETRQRIYDRFPNHVRFGNTNNRSNDSELPDSIRLTTDIIFTEKNYANTEEFLEEIDEIVPEKDREGGLLSAYRLEISDPYYLPDKEMAQRHLPADRLDTINVIEFLETGDSSRAITEIAINNLLGKKIRVRDLLAAIPVNVFVDAPPKQRDVVDATYENMKQELGVKELYDWGTFDPEDIAPLLITQDQQQHEERIASDEEWKEIAEQMIDNARQCERAAQ